MIALLLSFTLILEPTGPSFPHRNYALTPGVVATTDTVAICQAGAAGSTRSEQPVTVRLRNQVLNSYGIPSNTKGYTLDHVVPIELGGAPNDARNLFPGQPALERAKDRVEDAMHSAVCRNGLALWKAQGCMAFNWHLCQEWYLK